MAGTEASPKAFRDLVDVLLRATIMARQEIIRLNYVGDSFVISGSQKDAVRLKDRRYLRLTMTLYLEDTAQGRRLKVRSSSYQYQEDLAGDRWVFRYDYLREPKHPHPASHLQIRGELSESGCLPEHGLLERIHFPTSRVPLEAVIRLLAEPKGLKVPWNQRKATWRPMLAQSEAAFLGIAHRSISGPSEE
jgi:hypothetical protein